MLADLHAYYDEHGIGALGFSCRHRHFCAAGSPRFTTAKEAYVGPQYAVGTLPRLVFLSLDSGSGDPDASTRTLEAIREWMRTVNFATFPKSKHWAETHELACCLLRPFMPSLTVEQVGPYFAHTNSAKCCLNNPGNAVASERLFRNCRAFIPGEIVILRPDILVTQGDYARDAVNGAFTVESQRVAPEGGGECRVTVLRLAEGQRALWIHTPHPRASGVYWGHKNKCWPFFARAVAEFSDRPAPVTPLASAPSPPVRSYAGDSDAAREAVVAAFTTVFRMSGRPFGSARSPFRGVSDDARGVQWNAGVDQEQGTAWLGVNLEGMAYDGWPITRFIAQELGRPQFVDVCRTLPEASGTTMSWTRDAWQASARLAIAELQIRGTPVTLDRLTPERWRVILVDAYDCLDANRHRRGRALQTVTLKSGLVERPVSPHLHVHRILWRGGSPGADDAVAAIRRARLLLQPVYDFVCDRSGHW